MMVSNTALTTVAPTQQQGVCSTWHLLGLVVLLVREVVQHEHGLFGLQSDKHGNN